MTAKRLALVLTLSDTSVSTALVSPGCERREALGKMC